MSKKIKGKPGKKEVAKTKKKEKKTSGSKLKTSRSSSTTIKKSNKSAADKVKKVKAAPKKAATKKAVAKKAVSKKPVAKTRQLAKKSTTAKKTSKSKSPLTVSKKKTTTVKVVAKKANSSKKATVKKTAPAKKQAGKPEKNSIIKTSAKIIPKAATVKVEKSKNNTTVKKAEIALTVKEEKQKKFEEIFSRKRNDKKSDEVLAITNTIPVKAANEISPSRIASISSSITNPVKRADSYAVKVEKEPAGKFELEYIVHASSEMLFEFLSSPSGLSEWFCDDLNIRNGIYTFIWDDQLQQARLLKTVDLQLVRFQWVEKTDGSYFEFRIQRDDLTNDISLIITDFAENTSELESSKLLWNSQVEKLMQVLGSIY